MSDASILGCIISITLPWICGYLFCRLIFGTNLPWSCQVAHGYLVGLLIMTLVIRLFDATGTAFSFWPIVYCLILISFIEYIFDKLKRRRSVISGVTVKAQEEVVDRNLWINVFIGLILSIITYKAILAANEIILLPLFPWDAWDSWAPLTIQYYDSGGLGAEFQTKASTHGKTVSIIHLWGMLACETTSHPLTRLTWLFAGFATSLAVYGHILKQTSSALAAIMGAYFCFSLPYLYIHTVLAGYADIWLALTFTLGVLSLGLYTKMPHPGLIVLSIVYMVACANMKESGFLMGGCLLILLFLTLIRQSGWIRSNFFFTLLAGAFISIMAFLQFAPLVADMPYIVKPLLSSTELSIPAFATYQLNYKSIAYPLTESMILSSQTHLLTPMIFVTMVVLVLTRQWQLFGETSFLAILLGSTLIWLYFSLADFDGAAEHTGLTRAFICLMPSAVFWCVVSWTRAVRQTVNRDRPTIGHSHFDSLNEP